MDDIEKLQASIKDSQINDKPKEITATRGRLIRKLREEIAKAKTTGTEEDKNALEQMEEMLSTTIDEHKNQLNGRYKTEFINRSGSIKSVITALPKGVGLAIEKIKTCITALKDAKTNKERLFGLIDTLKSTGMLLATPVIFTGKFVVKHWYIVALFLAYLINLPGYIFGKTRENILEGGSLFEDIQETLHNPEELHEIAEGTKERLNDIPGGLRQDFEGAKEVYSFLKENLGTIHKLLHYGNSDKEQRETLFEKIKELTSEKNPVDLTNPEKQKETWELFKKMKELIPDLEQNNPMSLSPAR